MDGATTYCWEVDTSIYSNTVDGSSVQMTSAQGDGCPLELSLAWPTGDVYAYDSVDISWNATLREGSDGSLLTNDFGLTNLSVGLDRISQKYYEITASRLRTCLYGADCNPVTTGSQLTENTTNIPLNFSTDGLAQFDSSELSFDAAGNYTLLAHLILPSTTPTSKRYDYAVFLKVQVLSRSSASTTDSTTTQPYSESTSDSSSSGVSTEVICVLIIAGIVVVALAAIGFVTLRSKIDRPPEATASKHTTKRRGMFGFSAGTSGTGALAVVSDGDEEFAMLSMHEATIRRNSTYLSALSRGQRNSGAAIKKSDSPIQFAGPMCRKGVLADEDSLAGDITPQSITIETPATGRGNYTDMDGLDNTPKPLPPQKNTFDQSSGPRHIMFNDIMEDEVDSTGPSTVASTDAGARAGGPNFDHSVSSTVTDLNLTAVSVRIKQHRANAEQEEALHVKEDVLTADDLRDSEAQGPLALSDLYSSRIKR